MTNNEGHKALVTGASGFVGSRLVRHLVERGEPVKAFVREGSSLAALADLPAARVEIAVGDARVMHTVYRALAGCNRLYHVAAVYKMWAPRPADVMQPIVEGMEATLEAARRRDLSKVVVTSTLGTLGVTANPEAMTEEHSFNLKNSETYVMAKRRAEEIALDRAAKGEPIVVVCPSGIFGPGDWKPTPSGRLILEFLQRSVFFAPTTGGISVADVDDIAEGHRLAMERGRVGERYILAGDNLRHTELAQLLADIAGVDKRTVKATRGAALLTASLMELGARLRGTEPPITRKLVRDHGFNYVWGDSGKAEKELGYAHRPARSTFARALRWYLEHGYVTEKIARELSVATA